MHSTASARLPDPCIVYGFDAYCGWCWGVKAHISDLRAAYAGSVPVVVVSGALFVDERSRPIAAFPHIPGANQRIAETTGAVFGTDYQRVLQDGHLVLDSPDAAALLVALRTQAPDRAAELAGRLQEAFYVQGRSLSAYETAVDVAVAAGLDGPSVREALTSGAAHEGALGDFALSRELGITNYPTLIGWRDGQAARLPATGTPLPALLAAVQARLSGTTPTYSQAQASA